MALSCIVCKIKRDIDRKSWFFSYTLAFGAPVVGSPSEYCHPVWCGWTRMVGLPDGEKTLRICVTVYTQYRRVPDGQTDKRTDRETDRQTSCYGIIRAMHTRRAVKINAIWWNINTNVQKLADICGYELPTNLQNFTEKNLNEVKLFQTVLGGLLFWNTRYISC